MLKKVILTSKIEMYDMVVKSGDSAPEIDKWTFRLAPVFLNFSEITEEAIVCYYKGDNTSLFGALTYLFENFNIIKVISLDLAEINDSFEARAGDVFMPNTFITEDSLPPIFIEEVADKNYDLWDFGLLMNWICFSKISDDEKEIESDIIDKSAYAVVTNSEIKDLKDKTVIIRGIDTWNDMIFKNMYEVLELIF